MTFIIKTKSYFDKEIQYFNYEYTMAEIADCYNWYSNIDDNNVIYLNYNNFN